jgi:hypothetical protein
MGAVKNHPDSVQDKNHGGAASVTHFAAEDFYEPLNIVPMDVGAYRMLKHGLQKLATTGHK